MSDYRFGLIIGSCVFIAAGYQVGWSIIFDSGISGFVSVSIYGTISRRKERERRLKMLAKGEAK